MMSAVHLQNAMSHPSWVCGLKHCAPSYPSLSSNVTPFVGVWIETSVVRLCFIQSLVTPFVGVWIETSAKANDMRAAGLSHPSWVCGLKLYY